MKFEEGVCIKLSDLYSKEQIERINSFGVLVGLDQATKSGVARIYDGHIATERLVMQAKKNFGDELCDLTNHISALEPTFIAHEIPTGRFYNAIVKSSKILGGVILMASQNNIGTIGYTATEIKKYATGKGNANKEMMLREARKYAEFKTDDEADAFFILKKMIDDLLKDENNK